MERMKSIYLRTIKWRENFAETKGSYYDYAAELMSLNKQRHTVMCNELTVLGWKYVPTNNHVTVFYKDRHVVRIYRLY